MKIIKQFQDDELFERKYSRKSHPNGVWLWGLSENGELCFYCSVYGMPQWMAYSSALGPPILSLKEMMKIVKEFGHLMAFL